MRLLVNQKFAPTVAQWSLALLLLWLGTMRFAAGSAETLHQLVTDNRILPAVVGDISGGVVAGSVGVLELLTAVLLAAGARWKAGLRVGAMMAAGLSIVPLTLLFTNPVWIDQLGGFPAIGAGQGLIKYLAPVGVALFVLAHQAGSEPLRRRAQQIMLAGLLVPLVWIGVMKFTAVEAAGIQPLLSSSPFFAWMLSVFGQQGASNLIGFSELVTAGLLASWWFRPALFQWGAMLAAVTFLSTLSFLVSLPGWHPTSGFPVLSGAGQFVVKDIALLAAAIVLLSERLKDRDLA